MFVGLDTHKDFSYATFVDSKGRVVEREQFDNTPKNLESFARKVVKSRVVLEASSSAVPICDFLRDRSVEVVVAHPSKVKAIAEAKIKTDKIDSGVLALLLRADLIPEAYLPSREVRQLRDLARCRQSLVSERTGLKNKIHAVLTREGVKHGFSDLFGKKGRAFLRKVSLNPTARFSMDSMLEIMDVVDAKIADAKQKIVEEGNKNEHAKLLTTIPGVSWVSALIIAGEIGEIERFPDYRKLCSYAGLVPSTHQSGNTLYSGHITKRGSGMLRWILVQDARVAVKHSKKFGKQYRKLCKHTDERKAIVAVARKMLRIMYVMLVRKEAFKDA